MKLTFSKYLFSNYKIMHNSLGWELGGIGPI